MDRVIQLLINAAALYVAVLIIDGLDFSFDGRAPGWSSSWSPSSSAS